MKMNLLTLVKDNDIDGVRDFLSEHETINVNLQNKNENTALVLASRKNYIEIVKLLLEVESINVNIQNNSGNSALILASYNNYIEIIKLLLEHENINVNLQNKYGGTALMFAFWKSNMEIVKLLLEAENINVNLQDNNDDTALIFASKNSYIEIVELLLAKGATNAVNSNYSKKINAVLANWKTYLPRWNRFKTYKYYPKEFKEIATLWLLICKRKNLVSKDIKLLMIEYLAESWKFEIKI